MSDDDFRTVRFGIEANLSRIFNEAQSGHAVVVLDVPIGLSNGVRDCDALARRFLKPHRHNSVFRPPCRDAVASGLDYRRALEINRQRSGVGISKQAYCIGDRIRSVDELMTPALQKSVREGHPEVTLAVLDGDQPQEHHKKRAQGIADRLDVLRRAAVPPFDPQHERLRLGRSELEVDDIVDAAAMLATARRVANGLARSLPDSSEPDERGLQMAICA